MPIEEQAALLSGTPLAPYAFRMIVNGHRPTSAPPTPENNPSAPGARGSLDASGFSSLLFLIVAVAPQSAVNAALTDGDGNGDLSASNATDDGASVNLFPGIGATVNGTKGMKAAGDAVPCVAKMKSDSSGLPDPTAAIGSPKVAAPEFLAEPGSPPQEALPKSTRKRSAVDTAPRESGVVPDKTSEPGSPPESGAKVKLAPSKSTTELLSIPDSALGQAEGVSGEMMAPGFLTDPRDRSGHTITEPAKQPGLMPDSTIGQVKDGLGKIVAPGFFPEAITISPQVISILASDRGGIEAEMGQPIFAEPAPDEPKKAAIMVDTSEPRLSQLAKDGSPDNFDKTGIAVDRKEKSAPLATNAAAGAGTDSFIGVAKKNVEHPELRTVKPLVPGHVSKLIASAKSSEFSIQPSDVVDSEAMLGVKINSKSTSAGESADAEMSSFPADAKERETPGLTHNPTSWANETANPMAKAALPGEGPYPAMEVSTTQWRPTIERVTAEIVGHIQLNKREAIIHLDPPELGKIKIDLHLKGDKLQAHIFTEAHEARALIQNHIQELRQALQANNLDLVDVRVQGGWHGATGDAMHGFPQQQQQPGGQQEWGWASRSTVEGDAVEPQPNRRSTSERGRVSMWA